MTNVKDIKASIGFYNFWKWEYRRRRDGFDEIIVSEEEVGEGIIATTTAPGYCMTPTEILKSVLLGEPLPVMSLEEAEAIFGGASAVKLLPSTLRSNKIMIEVDPYKPDESLAEVAVLMTLARDKPSRDGVSLDFNDYGGDLRWRVAWARLPAEAKRAVEKRNHLPRAVGLWLWDYGEQLGSDRRWGWKAKAIKALRTKFNIPQYAASRHQTHEHQYSITAACINAAEVLPI